MEALPGIAFPGKQNGATMNRKRKELRDDETVSQFLRQFALMLVGGAMLGFAFSPTPISLLRLGWIPIIVGGIAAYYGLTEDKENSS